MEAMVPTRCRSSKPGSSVSGFFCSRKPTLASVRTASWAPATVFSRLIATGMTTPGKSTMLRTGRMISMSGGNVGVWRASADASGTGLGLSLVLICAPSANSAPGQQQPEATVREVLHGHRPGTGWQCEPPLEQPVWDLEPADRCAVPAMREPTLRLHEQLLAVELDLQPLRRHARQRHLDQQFAVALVDIDRRFPSGLPRLRGKLKALALQPVGLLKEVHRFGPHPMAGVASFHWRLPSGTADPRSLGQPGVSQHPRADFAGLVSRTYRFGARLPFAYCGSESNIGGWR